VLPPEVAVPDLRDAPAGAVARAAIAAGVTRLLAHDPGVRLGEDPEDVHQARVATRRLRSDLRTFRPLLDEKWTAEIRDELGWLADLLGAVRDTDVLLERLEADTAELAAGDAGPAASLLRRLRSERDEARAALLEALDSDRYTALVDLLVEAAGALPAAAPVEDGGGGGEREGVVQPSEQPAAKVVPGLVQRPWRHLRRAVDELSEDPPDESLHRVRILAKRCRYAAEAAAPVVGKPARRLAEAVAGLQGVLGDLNDAVIAEAWLRAAVTRGPAAQALVAGELVARQRQRAAACRTAWPAAWKRASAKRLRSWLDGD
jgi:CHAD domain-containing protein